MQLAWPLPFSATSDGQSVVLAPACVATLKDTLPEVTGEPLQSGDFTVAVNVVVPPSVAGLGLALIVVQVPVGPTV